jgi:phage-related protein
MGVTSGKELKVRYTADTSGIKKGVSDVEKETSKLGSSLGTKFKSVGASMAEAGKKATLGLTLPIVGAGIAAFKMADDYGDAAATVQQHIKTMGVAGTVSFKGLSDAARQFSMQTGIAQTELLGASGKLVTFANVAKRGTGFINETTQAAADLSASGFGSVSSASVMLGKALYNPLKGMTALTRVGVSFSDQQQKVIAHLMKTGQTAKAQAIILGAVQAQVGGTAKKIADPWDKAKASLQAAAITIGQALVPVVSKVADLVAKAAQWFQKLSPSMQHTVVVVAALAAALGPILIIGGKLFGAIGSIINGFKALQGAMQAFQIASKLAFVANPWFLLGAAIVAVAVLVITHWDTVKKFLLAVWDAIKGAAFAVWNAIKGYVELVAKIVIGYFKIWLAIGKAVFGALKAIAGAVWRAIGAYVKAWLIVTKAVFTVAKKVVLAVWNAIKKAAQTVWHWISTYIKVQIAIVRAVLGAIKAFAIAVWNGIKAVAINAWNAITAVVKRVWQGWQNIGHAIISFFSGVWGKVKDAGSSAWNGIKNAAQSAWNGIVGLAKSSLNGLISLINGLIRGMNTLISGFNRLPGPDLPAIGSIPYLAKGGRILAGGMAVVGERGPELVSLPTGAAVAPLSGPVGAGATSVDVAITIDRRRFGRGLELDALTRGY